MPKVKSPDEMRIVDELLTGPCAAIRFHVIIETNDGLAPAYEIAQSCDRIDPLLCQCSKLLAQRMICRCVQVTSNQAAVRTGCSS